MTSEEPLFLSAKKDANRQACALIAIAGLAGCILVAILGLLIWSLVPDLNPWNATQVVGLPKATDTPFPIHQMETVSPTATPLPEFITHRIGVRVVEGVGEFYDRITGEKFIPRGYNYVRLSPIFGTSGQMWEETLAPNYYDPELAEEALREMYADGYNVVRVVVDCCRPSANIGSQRGGISPAYIDNVIDFLNKAKAYDIFVLLVLHLTPADGGYNQYWDPYIPAFDKANLRYLTEGGFKGKRLYDQHFIRALINRNAPLDTVFAYDLTNDVSYDADWPPLSSETGKISTVNGKTYDMSKPEEKQKMMNENLVFWIDQQRAAILEVDPTALVTVSFHASITSSGAAYAQAAIWESTADFIDLHLYLGMGYTLEDYVKKFAVDGLTEKPVINGQFAAFRQGFPSATKAAQALLAWQAESCRYGFDGWILWLRGSEQYTSLWNGLSDGGVINDALAPENNPDPCNPVGMIPVQETPSLSPTVTARFTHIPAPVVRSSWTSYSSSRGIRDLTFDQKGNLWAATSGGAVVWRNDMTYTKYTWEHGLAGNSVQTVVVAPDGTVWFGTYGGGVARFDGQSWQTYTSRDGLAGDFVISSAVSPDGTLWFGTVYSGVSRFDGETWMTYSYGTTPGFAAFGPVIDIVVAPDGGVWLIAYDGGITRFDGQEWISFKNQAGMLPDGLYYAATVSEGELWVGAVSSNREAGLVHFDGETWESYTVPESHVRGEIQAVAVSKDETVWLSTREAVFTFDGENWGKYEIRDVSSIFLGVDGTVWFGTTKQGILALSSQGTTILAGDDYLSPYGTRSIAVGPAGDIWFAGLGGIAHFDGKGWLSYTSGDGLVEDDVDLIVVDSTGAVWASTDHGASRFFEGEWTSFTTRNSGLVNDDVEAIAIDPMGGVWFATMGGVSRFDGETWTTYTFADGLAADWVYSAAVDSHGVAWFGTRESISRFDGETWTTFSIEDGLWNINPGSLTIASDDTVWVGSINHLAYFDGDIWTTISIGGEMDAPSVNSIAIARDGNIWCSLRSIGDHPSYGVGRFDGLDWTVYSVADGLGSVDVNAIAAGPDGSLWFGTLAGVTRYLPP